jgi:hypothetical protein
MSSYRDLSGNSLTSVFGPRTGTDIGYDTGFREGNTDFRHLFLPLSQGENIGYNTNYIDSSNRDLRQVFGRAFSTINLTLTFQLQGRSAQSGPNTTRVVLETNTEPRQNIYTSPSITPSAGSWQTHTFNITNVPKRQVRLRFENTNTSGDRSNALYGVSLINSNTRQEHILNGTFTQPGQFIVNITDPRNGTTRQEIIITADVSDLYFPAGETNTPLTNWIGSYVILGQWQVWGYVEPPFPHQFVSLQEVGTGHNHGVIEQIINL